MARFNDETRKSRIKELIERLEKGVAVDKRDFNNAVGKDFAKLYKQRWAEQQELRKMEVPDAVKEYERMLQEAVMWHGRLDAYSGRNPKVGKVIVNRMQVMDDMKNKTDSLFESALTYLEEITTADASLQIWFDRDVSADFGLEPSAMPRVITSKSLDNLAKEDGMHKFGLRAKAELKLDVLHEALEDLENAGKDISSADGAKLKGMLAKLVKEAR